MKLKDGKSYARYADGNAPAPDCGLLVTRYDYERILRNLTRSQLHQMFRVRNLPETIPEYVFLRNAFLSGWQWVTELGGNLISFTGDISGGSGLGPGLDYNYLPTHIVVTNPYLEADGSIPDYTETYTGGYSKTHKLTDGVLVKTTSELMPLEPLVRFFAELEESATTTLHMSLDLSRMALNWLAKSDADKTAMEEYLRKIKRGELGVALSKEWQEAVELALGADSGAAALLKSQIEALQYVRGYKWQTFGVQSNHNMKREAINESEAGMNENSLLPLIDDIYANLKAGIDQINERYGTNITIEYASAWEEVQENTDEEVMDDGETGAGDKPGAGDTPDSGGSVGADDEPGADDDVSEPER